MLDPESVWVDEFKKLTPSSTPIEGITKLADVIEKLTNKVDPDLPGGQAAPGVFTWNKATFIGLMLQLQPTGTPDWIPKVANAWAAGCNTGIIAPGKVQAAAWTISSVDINTIPAVPATVPTVAAGQALIVSMMAAVPAIVASDAKQSPPQLAKAFRSAALALTFVLIGISGTPPSPVPLTLTAKAK